MEEVRQLVQEEGREARNLIAFHVAVDTPASRVSRKPPRTAAPRRPAPRGPTRLRSASAGRDKRSELRARYWALLFGDLQRAIGEIYNTVEVHENLNECQEVILVLENYTRDFKALCEWFRLKWEYDNTPPPQRPQSLAWEIRKTDFVRPESRRAYSVKSSPSVSGKNSPCLSGHNTPSGKNSPNLTGKASPGSGKISPRVSSGHSSTSPKGNIEFFSSKIAAKTTTKPEPKAGKEVSRLSDIKEKKKEEGDIKDVVKEDDKTKDKIDVASKDKDEKMGKAIKTSVEIGKAKEIANISPKQVVIKSPKRSIPAEEPKTVTAELSRQAKATISKLDAMENEFLVKHLNENAAKNDNILNKDKDIENDSKTTECKINVDEKTSAADDKASNSSESPVKSEDNFADISSESSPKYLDEKSLTTDEILTTEVKSTNVSENVTEPKKEQTEVAKDGENLKKVDNESPKINIKEATKESPKIKVESKSTEGKDDKKELETKKLETKQPEPKSRPAYSQAAAKPKPVVTKTEVKTPTRFTTLTRSKTVVEIRPNTAPKMQRQFPKRNQTNKCSYPFNLTTGRTSLFDSPANKGIISKKPLNRLQNIASGDNKASENKTDLKKRPPRPTSLKINDRGDKKENINPALEKIKDCDEYSSSDTIVTQIDMSRIESSESLKTLVPDELILIHDVANSIEVLNVDGSKNDDEGWLTVKSRRFSRESKKQSKSHWANRFHQPSATTSLPTLNMIESPKQETKSIINTAKVDRAKSEQPQNKPEKVVKVAIQPKTVSKGKNPAMIRQKSDVTGLKTRSSRNKALKKEKVKDMSEDDGDLTRNRLHSSLESLTTGLARSQESTEESFDFDRWKDEFKLTFKYLDEDEQITDHDEILRAADPSEMSEIAEMTSQIEENERKISWALDFQSEVDQRKLCEEEDLLNRQIMELQQVSDIDLDTETDDTETDAEILCEDTSIARVVCPSRCDSRPGAESLEAQYAAALAGMSWAERVDTLGVLEALGARDPGRAQQLHAKLSQGIKRRGSFQDALRRLQAKQARAERQRQEYQTERARKIHQLLARVEEVKVAKNQLIEEKRLRMERRLQRAAENRDQHLKDIVRKAHDEEEKLREIAFIKQLEAENRRHDFLDQCRSHTKRLRQMRRERLDKLEQKAAREAAVGARRQALQEARALHVFTMMERRRLRDQRQQQLRHLKQLERGHAAREKAEGVKSRLCALAAAAARQAVALRSRIRDKQDASRARLHEHLRAVRLRATATATPTPTCTLTSSCHGNSLEDQISREEKELAEEAERLEQEKKDREKQKAIKKKARKVKQKLMATCNEAIASENAASDYYAHPSSKMSKVIQQINNIIAPLLETENANVDKNKDIHQNGFDIDENPKKTKNKNKKLPNGDVEIKKLINNNNGEFNEVFSNSDKVNENEKTEKTEQIIENGATEGKDNVNGKKRNKKKNKELNERPKLSKTSSICSSLSDMSKTSGKSEKKTRLVIDMPFLERCLNELHRCMERFNKNLYDKATFRKINGMKTLGNLLTVVAERQDLAPQFTARCLTTAVVITSRAVGSCTVSAARFISTNTCVHVVKLLSEQLEKDLASDQKEMELAKQLSDCLSIALDSVLCSTRLFEEKAQKDEDGLLSALRNRAHTLISYICLCGCITRAEKAGEARESVQTLLTVCADLCHPCDVDVGTERASATQSLRCALGTGMCGSRAEFCMLFAQGADLGQSSGFVRAARTAHLLRALAELDQQIVQEAFGEGGWPLEFRAAVARLLSQHAPNDKEAPRTTALRLSNQRLDQTLSETMVLDLIVLVGFVVVNNPQLQETICEGWSVIKTLCTLPANWLVSKPHSHALLPTLIALAERPATSVAIAGELSTGMLDEYMESAEAQKIKLVQVIKQGRNKKTTGKK